jgi:hypothetical protein
MNMSNSNTTQGRAYHDIDTGHTIVSVSVEQGRHAKIITTFVNSLSVRSSALDLQRIRDGYIATVVAASRFPEGADTSVFTSTLLTLIKANLH